MKTKLLKKLRKRARLAIIARCLILCDGREKKYVIEPTESKARNLVVYHCEKDYNSAEEVSIALYDCRRRFVLELLTDIREQRINNELKKL